MTETPVTQIEQVQDHRHNGVDAPKIRPEDLNTPVPITMGGTGQTAKTAAFDALAPTSAQGDIIYHNGTDNVNLAKGTAGQLLKMNSGATAPEWGTAGAKIFTDYYYGNTGATINNTTNETFIVSTTLPGGVLGTDGAIIGRLYIGDLRTVGSSTTFTFKVYYGNDVGSIAITGSPTASYRGVFDFTLMGDGATNAQYSDLMLDLKVETEFAIDQGIVHKWSNADSYDIDSTTSQDLKVSITMSAADPLTRYAVAGVYLYKIN